MNEIKIISNTLNNKQTAYKTPSKIKEKAIPMNMAVSIIY
ncbi:hypothetical protein NHP164001_09750 [Helicobacter trogontum]|uniref:Uncharacterized protein n=1 Tax=Helicobacter trogontum TaxID=50960 RepID=A0ABQ0D454_9HELI